MVFAGDVVLSHHVEQFVGERDDYVFERWVADVASDVFMLNLEHPLTTSENKVEKEFNFKMHPRYVKTLQHGGVSIVAAANNHIADYGLEGILETMHALGSAGIAYVGIGSTLAEARKPVVIQRKGWRVGFLGYHGGQRFAATPTQAGLAPRVERYSVEDVRRLVGLVDYVVVNLHCGVEYAEHPEPWQVELAHRIVDAGADLIVGRHPHVLQGVESYRGATIAYSLGNFFLQREVH
jgi:poly-gamma-glutamate capsule biosynthesis protein CapA/YwtB (metallophosphatase superfamily)